MKTKETKRTFNSVIKDAKSEVKDFFASPFTIMNLLNKVASGKIEHPFIDTANVKAVAKVLLSEKRARYPFAAILLQTHNGKFSTIRKSKSARNTGTTCTM